MTILDETTIADLLKRLAESLQSFSTSDMTDKEYGELQRLITEAENMAYDIQARV